LTAQTILGQAVINKKMATKRSHESGTPRLQAFQARQTCCAKFAHNSKNLVILQGHACTFYSLLYSELSRQKKANEARINVYPIVCVSVFGTSPSSQLCNEQLLNAKAHGSEL
jgi:hypothetical protein